jgi:membrane protein
MAHHAGISAVPGAAVDRVHRGADAIRARYSHSWVEELVAHLNAVEFFDRTVVIGAELLWSALPFIVLLSSLADERIDDDISRHIGLNSHGAHIVRTLFRNHPAHAFVPIATALLIAFAGVVSVIQSLQVVYERLYGHDHYGWRDLPRYVVWVIVLLALLIAEASLATRVHGTAGDILQGLVTFVVVCAFFAWTIRLLLHGHVSWHDVAPSALATALLWVLLAMLSSAYFSTMVVDDSKTYGTIGVVFSFLTWFIVIGSVIVLGAALGAVWLNRHSPPEHADAPAVAE